VAQLYDKYMMFDCPTPYLNMMMMVMMMMMMMLLLMMMMMI
jgi:hypothetical protein